MIRRLEERMGVRLLTRTTRNVAPTEAGRQFVTTLRPAFNDIKARLDSITALRQRPVGNIRITSSFAGHPKPATSHDLTQHV